MNYLSRILVFREFGVTVGVFVIIFSIASYDGILIYLMITVIFIIGAIVFVGIFVFREGGIQ